LINGKTTGKSAARAPRPIQTIEKNVSHNLRGLRLLDEKAVFNAALFNAFFAKTRNAQLPDLVIDLAKRLRRIGAEISSFS